MGWRGTQAALAGPDERYALRLLSRGEVEERDSSAEAGGRRETSPGLFRAAVTNCAVEAMVNNRGRRSHDDDAAARPSGTGNTPAATIQAGQTPARQVPTPGPEAPEAGPNHQYTVPASPLPESPPVQQLTAPPTPQLQGQSGTAAQPAPPAPPAPTVTDEITEMTTMVDVINLEQPDQPTSQERVPVRTPEQIARDRLIRQHRARQRTKGVSGSTARPQGINRRPAAPQGNPRAKLYSQPVAPMLARIKRESDEDAMHWERHEALAKRYHATSTATRRRAEQLITRLHYRPHELTFRDLCNARCLIETHQCTEFSMGRRRGNEGAPE